MHYVLLIRILFYVGDESLDRVHENVLKNR